jgi:hypothetical protein
MRNSSGGESAESWTSTSKRDGTRAAHQVLRYSAVLAVLAMCFAPTVAATQGDDVASSGSGM